MKATTKEASRLYLLNAALLATHEIDSAYWHEWELFYLPGGIQFFLIINFVLLWIVMFGLTLVVVWAPGARLFSYALAGVGVFAFTAHTIFIALGHFQFRTPVSISLLVATLVVSLAQVLAVSSLQRQTIAPRPT